MSEEDKQSKLTENDIKAINGFADFLNGISKNNNIPKIKTQCKYCKDDMEGKEINCKGSHAIETYIDDAFLYEYCKCGCHTVKRIYYCPMCGRKLGE